MSGLYRLLTLFSTLIAVLFLVATACPAQGPTPGYRAPGTPEVGGIEHMVLIYHGYRNRVAWTKKAFMPYVAYVDEEGVPQDWFFDSFLFTEFITDEGVWLNFDREKRGKPLLPTIDDWIWLADAWFRPNTGLVGLEEAVEEVANTVGPPDRRAKVVIAIPVPLSRDTSFGPLPGRDYTLDFRATNDRLQAVQWYVERVLDQWGEHDYDHLQLVGFYWLDEVVQEPNHELLRHIAAYLHARDYKFFRIPAGYDPNAWKEIGFDAIMPHPRYYYPKGEAYLGLAEFQKAARRAYRYNMGFELEFCKRALTDEKYTARMIAALDAGAHYGWMEGAVMSYYQGNDSIRQFATTAGTGRNLYQKLYEYVKGTYVPSGTNDFSAVPAFTDNHTLLGSVEIIYPSNTPSEAGDHGFITQIVGVEARERASVTFCHSDSHRDREEIRGYHVMQLRVDDEVVWEKDVVGADSKAVTVDISEAVGGKEKIRLSLGIFEKRGVGNCRVRIEFLNLRTEGLELRNGDIGSAEAWEVDTAGAFEMEFTPAMQADSRPSNNLSKTPQVPEPTNGPKRDIAVDKLLEKALSLKRDGNYEAAVSNCREVIAADATIAEAHWVLAWVLVAQDLTAEAIAEFEEFVRVAGDDERIREAESAIERLQQ